METKVVLFEGDSLLAVQEKDEEVWVGVRTVCEGLGLRESRMKLERKKLQTDLVLSRGTKFYPIGKNGAEMLCLHLDYLPLWLAKISITPAMKRDQPELVEKLIQYQLKAKDILAAAFIRRSEQGDQNTINLILLLNKKLNKLYADMNGRFDELEKRVEHKVEQTVLIPEQNKLMAAPAQRSTLFQGRDFKSWKQDVYTLCERVIKTNPAYLSNADVLHDIYEYMRRVYSVVWEQEKKEHKASYGHGIRNLDIIYENDTYRSIFISLLNDKVLDTESSLEDIIAPLVHKRDDKSLHGCATFKMVYKRMEIDGVLWDKQKRKYFKVHPDVKTVRITKIIKDDPVLKDKFRKAIRGLMKEGD